MPARRKKHVMRRLEIQLPGRLLAWLRAEARRRDASLAEVIRAALAAAHADQAHDG